MSASARTCRFDLDALAAKLQNDRAARFVKSWNDLMNFIDKQSAALRT
ncbi:MAG: hypothetical protein L0K86_12470 [Actinomycetia bacterium]|nr:hypothetical protein [Actinomycetes bacterium]